MATSRSSGSASRLITACLAAALALVPRVSTAKSVVVLEFSGPKASKFRNMVGKILTEDHTIVSVRKYERAARKLGARSMSKRNVRRVAKKIGADGVVTGEVQRKGDKYRLVVRLRSGSSGAFVGERVSVTVRGTKLSSKAKRRLREDLSRALDELGSNDRGDDAEEEEEEDEDEDEDEDEEEDEDEDEDEDDGDGEPEDEGQALDLSDEELADLKVRGRGLIISAGVGPIVRNLDFNSASLEPDGYNSSVVPAGVLKADLYPLAFNLANKSETRNIGLSVELEQILQVKTEVEGGGGAVDLPTEHRRYAIGVIARRNFGTTPTSPTLTASIRYNRARFEIDRAPAEAMGIIVDVPNVDYTYYDPGIGVRYPFNEKTAFGGEAKFLYVTEAGEIEDEDQYGEASVTGFDVGVHVEYKVNPRLFILAGARAIGFAFDFNPTEGEVPALIDRNGDGVQDVGGGLDRYLGGYLSAGYLF